MMFTTEKTVLPPVWGTIRAPGLQAELRSGGSAACEYTGTT